MASELIDGKKSKAARDKDAQDEVDKMVRRRWIRKFSSKFAAKRYLKGKVVLSELIVIAKTKRQLREGRVISKTKKRLILNLKKSGVTAVAVKGERPELPRVLDVIFANLEMLRRRRQQRGKGLRHVILDFSNAFFQFPTRADERRFFATRLGKSVLVWLRTAQGSRGAPLICGRALALVMRLAASTVPPDAMTASCYVDDPLSTFIGSQEGQDNHIAKFVGVHLGNGLRAVVSEGARQRHGAGGHMDVG